MNIVLDPGHGKNTSGKRSPDSTLMEYEFNQDVCNKVLQLLKDNKFGISLIMTRPLNGNDTPLAERCRIAKNFKPDLLFSVHANAYNPPANIKQPDGSIKVVYQNIWNSANGFEVFYGHKHSPVECNQLADMFIKNVKPMNEKYQIRFRRKESNSKFNFYILNGVNTPCILIEFAFFTNKRECELLKSQEYRMDAANVIVKTIMEWRDLKKK